MDTLLADDNGVLVDTYGNAQFSRDVIARFPSLRKDLEFDANLLHVQMGTLAAAVREAVLAGRQQSAAANMHVPRRSIE